MQGESNHLTYLPSVEPSPGLLDKILRKIHTVRLKQIRFRLALAISGVLGSAIYTIVSWSAIGAEVRQSSFLGLLRLVGSDSDIVLANAKDLALGLLESIPLETVLLSLILCFSALVALLLVSAMRSERRILNHSL